MTFNRPPVLLLATLLATALVLSATAVRPDDEDHAPKPVKPAVFIFTDANTDDVQAIQLLLKFKKDLDVKALITVCTGFCNMGPAIQNLFGLLAFVGREDVAVWAGDAYGELEVSSGAFGCTYQATVELFPKGKIWADTLLGLNQRFPRLENPQRNYFPNFTSVYNELPAAIAALEPNQPVYFLLWVRSRPSIRSSPCSQPSRPESTACS